MLERRTQGSIRTRFLSSHVSAVGWSMGFVCRRLLLGRSQALQNPEPSQEGHLNKELYFPTTVWVWTLHQKKKKISLLDRFKCACQRNTVKLDAFVVRM